MKKTLTVLMTVLITAMLFVSCGEDPFFHTVSIKDGDKVVKTEIVRDGEEYSLPEKVDGIDVISGWKVDGKTYSAGEKIKVTSDITITVITSYKVTFDLKGGIGDIEMQQVKKGGKVTKPADPTMEGYYLAAWNTADNKKFDFTNDTVTADTTLTAVWKKVFTVGKTGPAGGTVFYDVDADNASGNADGLVSYDCGWRYLEAALNDCGSNFKYAWGSKVSPEGNSEKIGTGKSNTQALIDAKKADSSLSFPAAEACDGYYTTDSETGEKFDDWFLPSKNELMLMTSILGNTTEYVSYWSSSVTDVNDYAWIVSFKTSATGYPTHFKNEKFPVRAIRSF